MKIFMERSSGLPVSGLKFFPGRKHGFQDITNTPSPTIDTKPRMLVIERSGEAQQTMSSKPPYAVPSMEDIRQIPWNGFTCVSTFSGCGGSSTGYRMAGFKVLWASEFIDAARECYLANAAPHTIVDGRDIRQVTPEDILTATGLKVGELDLFDGSPPCASFSTAGKRQKGWGVVKSYSDKEQRSDDLFFEYARLLKGLQPKVFVAENVSGRVKGSAKAFFLEILRELKACGYKVSCRVLDAQWLGVPQARQRTIFVGVRNDLGLDPAHPEPLTYRYSVLEALETLVGLPQPMPQQGVARATERLLAVGGNGPFGEERWVGPDPPARTIGASPSTGNGLAGGGDVLVARNPANEDALACQYGPSISKYAIGEEAEKLRQGERSTRYFSLAKAREDAPCPTICAQHGNISTSGIPHPCEKRKFSIAELKRICGFPDDFTLTGTYAQQWERCGRAVPPVMMYAIAACVRDRILAKTNA